MKYQNTYKIPVEESVRYILSKEVQISVEDLTEEEILKLTKPQLQIALKKMRTLLLGSRKQNDELQLMMGSFDSMAELLKQNNYDVVKSKK